VTSVVSDLGGLETHGLSVAYGGELAVADVTLTAPLGRITGLIGPNGAGKTTTFNACNGLVRPARGSVYLFGLDVSSKDPAARARLGLGRTFQRVEVCTAASVRTNVQLGLEARMAASNPIRQAWSTRRQRRDLQEAVDDALETCGIAALADREAAGLSTGQRRLLELARVIAGGFRLLLLDEPSSGLDSEETARFGAILRGVVEDRRLGILLVEHDMSIVMSVCRYLYVLDFGHLIFEGTPLDAQRSEIVRAAYLGSETHQEVTR